MIVGADDTDDRAILRTSARLYGSYHLKRIYFSAFSPIPDASAALPARTPPLMREHRLYQADWLMRFYGFEEGEITAHRGDGMLDLDLDPKLSWALFNRHLFPVDINQAPRERLLRVPGLGTRSVKKALEARRHRRLRLEDVGRLCRSLETVRPFLVAEGWHPGAMLDRADLAARFAPRPAQLDLFG